MARPFGRVCFSHGRREVHGRGIVTPCLKFDEVHTFGVSAYMPNQVETTLECFSVQGVGRSKAAEWIKGGH
jgi:hypothetical protein